MPIYNFPLEFDCLTLNTVQKEICLPIKVDCNPIDPDDPENWFNHPGDEWNNNLCQTDKCYFIPFIEGDKIMLQTLFVDPGRDTPTAYDDLVLVEMLDENDNVIIADGNAEGLRRISGWTGSKNYQMIEFDLESLANCYKIRFTSQEISIVTNSFKILPSCRNTIVLKGDWKTLDCFGYFYGEPEEYEGDLFTYDNSMRYYASIKGDGGQISKERFGRHVTNGRIVTNFKIILAQMIPPYAKNIMERQHLGAERIYIDGNEYIFDEVLIEPEDTKNNMFFFTVRPQKICTINYRC